MLFNPRLYLNAVVILIAVFLAICLIYPAVNTGPHASKKIITECRVSELSTALCAYMANNEISPNTTLKEMIPKLTTGKIKYLVPESPPKTFFFWKRYADFMNKKGEVMDGWGNPLQVKIDVKTSKLIIKSFGENGLDDYGGGDDILQTITYKSAKL